MRTHQYAHKKRASQSFRTPVSRPTEVQASVQPVLIQAKSNEEGLAEHAERLRKFQRLGNSMMQMGPPRLDNNTTSSVQPKPWIQRKLTIGEPRDKYEQEADRVASQVVRRINAPADKENNLRQPIQREKVLEGKMYARGFQAAIQRKQAIDGGEASPDLESTINSAKGSGQPLDAGLQQSMGQAMGADFGGVRVHTDAQSEQLNQSIQARAFTTGQDVFFRKGAYQPGNRGGQELIAHELTHVVQQNGEVVQTSPQSNKKFIEYPNLETSELSSDLYRRNVLGLIQRLETDPTKNVDGVLKLSDINNVFDRHKKSVPKDSLVKKIQSKLKKYTASDILPINFLEEMVQAIIKVTSNKSLEWKAEMIDLLLLGLPQDNQQRGLLKQVQGLVNSDKVVEPMPWGRDQLRFTTFTTKDGETTSLALIIGDINNQPNPDAVIHYLEGKFNKDDLQRLLCLSSVNDALQSYFNDYTVPNTISPAILQKLKDLIDEYSKTVDQDRIQIARINFFEYIREIEINEPKVMGELSKLSTQSNVSFGKICEIIEEGKECNQEIAGFFRNLLKNAPREKPDPSKWLSWLKQLQGKSKLVEMPDSLLVGLPRRKVAKKKALPSVKNAFEKYKKKKKQ